MCDDDDCSVAVHGELPDEPKLFALVHELKHHYCDREDLGAGVIHCGDYDANELIEKGAEVFAAEFIYPEVEFAEDLRCLGIAVWKAENVVVLKRRCKAKVSYRFLCKRLERLGLIVPGQFDGIQFKKLEDEIFGVPFYRQRARRGHRKGSPLGQVAGFIDLRDKIGDVHRRVGQRATFHPSPRHKQGGISHRGPRSGEGLIESGGHARTIFSTSSRVIWSLVRS